jgi:hypothetical protein
MDLTFLGREVSVERLDAACVQGSVLLEGARGVGKTRLLKAVEARSKAGRIVLRFDLQGVASVEQLQRRMLEHHELHRNAVEELVGSLLGGWRRDDPWESLKSLLEHRTSHCVVLFDEVAIYLDQLARRDREQACRDLLAIDRLRVSAGVRFVLAGSIALGPVASQLGVTLSPDWVPLRLEPLDRASGTTLFGHQCDGVCDGEPAVHGWRLAGGIPRWIERLARATQAPVGHAVALADVEAGVERLLATDPFAEELDHLQRHPEAKRLRRALELAALPNATRISVLTGLQAEHHSRREAADALAILEREFILHQDATFALPLFGRWLRRRA